MWMTSYLSQIIQRILCTVFQKKICYDRTWNFVVDRKAILAECERYESRLCRTWVREILLLKNKPWRVRKVIIEVIKKARE